MSHAWGARSGAALLALLLVSLGLAGCGGDSPAATPAPTAEPTSALPVTVVDAWVRATPGESAGQMTAAYLTLRNDGARAERLVGARAEGAGAVEIHATMPQGEVMRMAPAAGVDLPAGESVELAPGGLHLMLLDLADPLAPGDTVALTLVFASGLELPVAAEVRPLVEE